MQPTGVQLKLEAKLLAVTGLKTKHADFIILNKVFIMDSNIVFIISIFSSLGSKGHVTYCHTNVSVMHCPSTLENKYSNIFYKTTGPSILKFHMEHDLTPGFQNGKIEQDCSSLTKFSLFSFLLTLSQELVRLKLLEL